MQLAHNQRNKIYIFFFCLLYLPILGSAQMQYVFGDNVNVRSAPEVTADKLCQLPAGHPIDVIGSTDDLDTLMGMAEPWHEVEFEWKGKQQKGWIWGGLTCWQSAELKDGSLVLMGRRADEDGMTQHRILILKGKKTLLDTQIESGYGVEELENFGAASYESYVNIDLKGLECVLILAAEISPCGYSGDFKVYGWTGKSLIHAFDFESSGGMNYDEEGMGYMEQYNGELIFPTDKGGRPGLIGYHSWNTSFDEEKEEEITENDSIEWYAFNGKEFIPVE